MSSETITRIDELERELARHALAFRNSSEGSTERAEAIANYHRVLKSLMESEGWCGTPDLDSQLPDEFMPQFYKDYWSKAAQVSIDDLQGDLLKLGDEYVLRRGDFLSLPLYVMSGVLKENLAAHDRKASVQPRLPEAKYSFPPYEVTATWLSRMRTDSNVAAAVVEQWWSHLSCFMGSVQLEHESTQLKFLSLSRHTELVSAYCDSELKMDSAVLWRCLTAAQAFEQVHHSYREDPQCKEKREYYVGRLNNVWPAYAAAIHEADSLKHRIRNAIALAHQTKHFAYPLKGRAMKKTVVELDLIGYSTICDLLEEMAGVEAVTNLNKEIQAFVDAGLERIRAERAKVVMQTTGDGAILVLEQPADAHRFAEAVHEATHKHNERKNKPVGKRVFRIGAATGDLAMEQKEDGRYEMAGMTIARAVRLERKASPGGVLVDSDTHEGLTEQQKQLYQGPEQIAGKRDEMFSAYQCIMCPDAAKNVEYFVEQAKQKPDAKPIKPATLGVERERREILNRFELLKPHHFSSLVFLMNIPVNRRPPDTVDLERQKKHILDWADQDGRLGELLLELRGLQTDETTNP